MLPGWVSNKQASCLITHIPRTHHNDRPEALHPAHIPRTHHNDLPEALHPAHIPHTHHNDRPKALHPNQGCLHYPRAHLLNQHPNFGLCFVAVNPVFIRRSKSSSFVCSIAYWPYQVHQRGMQWESGATKHHFPLTVVSLPTRSLLMPIWLIVLIVLASIVLDLGRLVAHFIVL